MSLSKSSSFLASFWCFVLTVTLVFIVIISGSCLFACHHITTLFQGCYNYLIVLTIKIQSGCFDFPYVHWSCWRMAGKFDPHLQHYNDCSYTSWMFVCEWCKVQKQKLKGKSCHVPSYVTVTAVLTAIMDNQWFGRLLFHSLVTA